VENLSRACFSLSGKVTCLIEQVSIIAAWSPIASSSARNGKQTLHVLMTELLQPATP